MGSCSPFPPLRQHLGGTPILMSSQASGRSQQRDCAAGGGEGRAPIVTAPTAFPAPVAVVGDLTRHHKVYVIFVRVNSYWVFVS